MARATFMEARIKLRCSDDLSEQQYDRLMDEHASALSAELDAALNDVRLGLMETWARRIPGFAVSTDVD